MGLQTFKEHNQIAIFAVFCLFLGLFLEAIAYFIFFKESIPEFVFVTIGVTFFCVLSFYYFLKLKSINNEHNNKIKHYKKYNTLTGLPNLHHFLNKTVDIIKDHEIKKDSIDNIDLYFINVGINRFKIVNSVFGYSYGDRILVLIKNQIEIAIGSELFLSKLNGDEFGVLYLGNKSGLERVIKKLKSVFNKEYKVNSSDFGIIINGRLGVVKCSGNIKEPKDIIKKADIALGYAKHESVFVKHYNDKLVYNKIDLLLVEKELKNDILNNRIDVVYQPKISIETGEIIGVEALARWYCKSKKEFISPQKFIKIAEDMDLISELSFIVFKKSTNLIKRLKEVGVNDCKVAINVSAFQFKKTLPERLANIISDANLENKNFEIEVTESSVIKDRNSGRELLKEIQSQGITIAIDDFGTGYSSLEYLVDLPLDILKIDKTFVDKLMAEDPKIYKKGASVISTIVALSHSIGCKVVAEGVETQEQYDFLKGVNCDYIQGYLISKPLNENDIFNFIKKNK